MIISNGGIERVLGPHLQKIYKSNSVKKAGTAAATDSVSISAEARLMQLAKSTAASLPDIREDRVAALRQAIEGGSYSVSDSAVAASIIGRRV